MMKFRKAYKLKIIIPFITLIFFIANMAYVDKSIYQDYSKTILRVPVGNNIERLKETIEVYESISKKDIDILDRLIQVSSLKGWKGAKEAVEEKFSKTEDRKKALGGIKSLAIKLKKNKIDQVGQCLQAGIPTAVEVASDIDEFLLFVELAEKLADYKIYPLNALYAILPLSRLAVDNRKTKLKYICAILYNFGTRLKDDNIEPGDFFDGVAELNMLAKSMPELEAGCEYLYNFKIALAKNKISNSYMFKPPNSAIHPIAEAASSIDEFGLFINLGIKLCGMKIDPYYVFEATIPAIAKGIKNSEIKSGLSDVCNNIIPRILEAAPKLAEDYSTAKDMLVKKIKEAITIKDGAGNFTVEFNDTTWPIDRKVTISGIDAARATRDDL